MRLRRRHFHWISLVLVLILATLVTARPDWFRSNLKTAEQNQPGLYSINHFVDGDTIAVNMNGSVETIRMIGVDTPETHKPNTPVQCFGNEAASYTKQLIGKNEVRLQADSQDTNRDRYGRLLRYVYLPDGTLVEKRLISQGYGFAYTQFPFEKSDEFKTLEDQAKASRQGLWGACQVTVEANGRQQTNAVGSTP
jgi:micrococcal nuclease